MAKPPQPLKLQLEDYPDLDRSTAEKLFPKLNQFFDEVGNALDRKLTLAENLSAQFRPIEVVTASAFPLKLKSGIGRPVGVFIAQAVDASTKQGAVSGAPAWDWDGVDSVIIRAIPNLPAGTYTVTFLLIAG